MPNINDYVRWRGDLPFSLCPLNEVDSLIFSVLAYLEMNEIVPAEIGDAVSVAALYERYKKAGYDQSRMFTDASVILAYMKDAPRFETLRVFGYENIVQTERQYQFAAVSLILPDESVFVTFRGTDDSIVGWREDVALTYTATPGQKKAAEYLSRIGAITKGKLYVGGHSKGGNFAVYASAFCDKAVKERIEQVYSFDGPGFTADVINSEEYKSIIDRVRMILPEGSLIGALLTNKAEKHYIKSSKKAGLPQHDPYTWQVMGAEFLAAKARSGSGELLDKAISGWVDGLLPEQVEIIEGVVFDTLDRSGASSLHDLSDNRLKSLNSIIRATKNIDPESAKVVTSTLGTLIQHYYGVLWNETRKRFERK